ncbi:MAG: hypothetical protein BGO95_07050 [Micrococcales bacterium 73-13]|nr:MAG: hypothetical protein BGO95_07050 [Micrococcales bacterium 73-13]
MDDRMPTPTEPELEPGGGGPSLDADRQHHRQDQPVEGPDHDETEVDDMETDWVLADDDEDDEQVVEEDDVLDALDPGGL